MTDVMHLVIVLCEIIYTLVKLICFGYVFFHKIDRSINLVFRYSVETVIYKGPHFFFLSVPVDMERYDKGSIPVSRKRLCGVAC